MFSLDSDIYTKNRAAGLAERLGTSTIQENDQKVQKAKIERAAQYLNMATPENWQAVRQQAIGEGFGNEDTIPTDYNKDWIDRTSQAFMDHKSDIPSSIQEYSFYNKLGPPEQAKYLNVKRAQQVINLGGQQVVRDPTGGIAETYNVTPKPDNLPGLKMQQAKATEMGKQQGETESDLNADQAALPQLEAATKQLSDLGKNATYTYAGQARDSLVRQLGMGATEGATARSGYIAHVKNNVLPLLRRTFGAQFTKAEGDSLLATLGDPNSSPEEKDATLRALIEDKKATLQTKRRQTGKTLDSPIGQDNQPKQAPDGNFYVPDPQRPGKYLQVVQ